MNRITDPLLSSAIEVINQEGKATISILQRKLRIGYGRAAYLLNAVEEVRIRVAADKLVEAADHPLLATLEGKKRLAAAVEEYRKATK